MEVGPNSGLTAIISVPGRANERAASPIPAVISRVVLGLMTLILIAYLLSCLMSFATAAAGAASLGGRGGIEFQGRRDDDAVIVLGAFDGNIAVQHVFQNVPFRARQWVAITAAAGSGQRQ